MHTAKTGDYSLGQLRARVFARIEPLAPAGLEAHRDGELLSRMVADIDQLQDLALRLLPLGVAAVAGTMMVAAGVWNDRALVGSRSATPAPFLADPSALVLDEPTAHLGGDTAAALLDDRVPGPRPLPAWRP